MTNPDPMLVQHYAVLKGISMKEAREKLRNNYEAEVKEIPLRDLVLRTLTGMRQVVPKVEGIAQREAGMLARVQKVENGLQRIAMQLEQDTVLRERVSRLEDYVESQKRALGYKDPMQEKLEELEEEIKYLKLPWYRKLMCRFRQKTK